MGWFQSIFYGFFAGLANFIPVSAIAHESFLQTLMGTDEFPLMQMMVHLGALTAVYVSCRSQIARLRRQQRLAHRRPSKQKRSMLSRSLMDLKMLKLIGLIICIGFILYPITRKLRYNFVVISVFLLLNGVLLLIMQQLPQGNKDARMMSPADSILVGLMASLAMIPGFSRLGAMLLAFKIRGVDREYALHCAYLLLIPALLILIFFDLYFLIASGLTGITLVFVLKCILSAIASLGGASTGIAFMRFLSVKAGFGAFAYYSWGVALVTFVLFLAAS